MNQTFNISQDDEKKILEYIKGINSAIDNLEVDDTTKTLLKFNCGKIEKEVTSKTPNKDIIKSSIDAILVFSKGIAGTKDIITGLLSIANILQQNGIDLSHIGKLFGR